MLIVEYGNVVLETPPDDVLSKVLVDSSSVMGSRIFISYICF